MAENLVRMNVAQHRTNHDWARIINNYWGRQVARVEPVMGRDRDGNVAMIGSIITSSQPWPGGYPQK
jgi:hypothetical protein